MHNWSGCMVNFERVQPWIPLNIGTNKISTGRMVDERKKNMDEFAWNLIKIRYRSNTGPGLINVLCTCILYGSHSYRNRSSYYKYFRCLFKLVFEVYMFACNQARSNAGCHQWKHIHFLIVITTSCNSMFRYKNPILIEMWAAWTEQN